MAIKFSGSKRLRGQASDSSRLSLSSLRDEIGEVGRDELDSEMSNGHPFKRSRTSLNASIFRTNELSQRYSQPSGRPENWKRANEVARPGKGGIPDPSVYEQCPERKLRGRPSPHVAKDLDGEPIEQNAIHEGYMGRRRRPTMITPVAKTKLSRTGPFQGKGPSLQQSTLSTVIGEAQRALPRRSGRPPKEDSRPQPTAVNRRVSKVSKRRVKDPPSASRDPQVQNPSRASPEQMLGFPARHDHSIQSPSGPGNVDPSAPRPLVRRRPYTSITARTRHIPRKTIEAEWTALAPVSIASVAALLDLAERPIVMRLATRGSRRQHAATAIRAVSRHVVGKLVKGLPFPPATATGGKSPAMTAGAMIEDFGRLLELNLERALDGVRALERRLDPLVHSVEILEAERRRLQAELDAEREDLRRLESNSRLELRETRDSLRRHAHPLLPNPSPANDDFIIDPDHGGLFQIICEDNHLQELGNRLVDHTESMSGNALQVNRLLSRIPEVAAGLRLALQRHLGTSQVEVALFG